MSRAELQNTSSQRATPVGLAAGGAPSPSESRRVMRCPQCGQKFSSEGRFCPFDAEPLVEASQWDAQGDPLLGETIDQRYELEAVIGEGGMGRVYRVRHVALDKRFALKALRQDLATDPEIAARFIHEARTAASVTHPGLVQISDFGHLPTGQAYFVMELLDGPPLSALLRRFGALPASRAVRIAMQIADALGVAHAVGVVHRDLKPDNIHLRSIDDDDGDEEVKIVDFGLAKVIGASRITREGVVFGTPYYMSPEQASGEALDHRADIYALGVLLYEMLTGRVPFEAETYMAVLTKHIYMKPIPPSELLALPRDLDALEEIVMRCLEKNPDDRFSSLGEVRDALAALPTAALDGVRALRSTPEGRADEHLEFDTMALESLQRPGPPRWLLGAALLVVSGGLGAVVVGTVLSRDTRKQPAAAASSTSPARVVPTTASAVPQTNPVPAVEVPAAHPQSGSEKLDGGASRSGRHSPEPRRSAAPKPARGKVLSSSRDIVDPWAK